MDSPLSNDNYFKINFFNIDSYVTKPHLNHDRTYSDYRKSNINLATVVRVFGSTDSGIKTCIHIHQHCPHLSLRHKDLVEAFGIISEDSEIEQKTLNNLIQDVENDLIKYINSKNGNEIFIVNVEKYNAYSFYGYHDKQELFYKIYFNSFWMANKAKQSLESGLVKNYKFVCYNFLEFLLQFYCDHQIYLNILYFKKISFRKPSIENSNQESSYCSFESIRKQKFLYIKNFINYNDLPPTSTCTLECDASINDIILLERRKTIFPLNDIFNPTMPGIVELWNKQHRRSSQEFENLLKVLKVPFYEQFEQTFQYNQIKKDCLVEKDFHDHKIPQTDGANDSSLVQSKIFCVFKKKRIEINIEEFKNSWVVCQKIDQIKKSSDKNPKCEIRNFLISIENSSKKEFLGTIENKIKSFQQSTINLNKLKKELKTNKLKNLLIKQKPTSFPDGNQKQLKLYFSKKENLIPKQSKLESKFRRFPISMLNESKFFQNSIQFNKIPQNILNISNTLLNKTSNTRSTLDCKNESFDQLNDMFEWSQCLNMTLMSLELHARVRQNLTPDPNYDPIQMVVFAVYEEFLTDFQPKQNLMFEKVKRKKSNILYMGCIIVRSKISVSFENLILNDRNLSIDYVQTELDLISKLAFYVRNFDPDIVLGYVVDTFSWGYLLQRASNLGIEIGPLFSRINNPHQSKRSSPGELNKSPHLIGRIVLNTWRLLRHELTLRSYTFETVHHHLFKRRYPKYPNELLSTIWNMFTLKQNDLCKHLIIEYYLERVLGSLRILTHLNFIRRTFDLSCLFGMQFQDVIDRGTQFRVESMLFPLCHTEKFLPIRFGQDFIKQQKACQATPMIFEPMTAFHQEPVAVFDFQSLYPSIVIAYNYCYSTCLGRLQNIFQDLHQFGCYRKPCDKTILDRLGRNNIHISPNDVLFVKRCVRRGMLPRMLEEILNTRILVKKELKNVDRELSLLMVKPNPLQAEQRKKLRALKRQLDISQLGLKLIANVTYGYTNANFSGRMPCVEVADAIVSKGRETLEEVVVFINEWGTRSGTKVKVIYGDTDSLFVSFPNTSVENAFEIANFLLKEINQRQTYPICLKLEKIYKPCILLAKKRYCGFAYESPTTSAKFDAKGIETIRRDTCNITAKIMDKCIKILSECNGDIDSLKSYLQLKFKKIQTGQLNHLEDFIFAREFHGFQNYCHEKIIPACIIARKRMELDPRNQPKFKERVPYIIVDHSHMKITRICDLVREPIDFLQDESLKINARYYINNVIIPPLVRILDSVHNNGLTILQSWYEEVRHSKRNINFITSKHLKKLSSIQSILPMDLWQSRDKLLNNTTINRYSKPATLILNSIWNIGQKLKHHEWICSRCCQTDIRTLVSLSSSSINHHRCLVDNCPNLFNYHQTQKDLQFLYFWDQALLIKLNSDDNNNDTNNVNK